MIKHPQVRKHDHDLPKISSWGRGGWSWMWRSRSPCWREGRWWDRGRELRNRCAAVFILSEPPTLSFRRHRCCSVTSSFTSPGCGECDHMVTCFGEESDVAQQVQQSPQLENPSTSRYTAHPQSSVELAPRPPQRKRKKQKESYKSDRLLWFWCVILDKRV